MSVATTVPLAEVATIVMGQSPPGHTYNEIGEGLPFFQGKAEFGEVSPTPKKWCSAPRRTAEAGDILMSVRAPVGPINLASERCCIGRGLAAIRADATRLDGSYLRFFLRHVEPKLASMGQGSTFTAIGRAEIASLRIPLLSLDEQRRAADLLFRAAGIVRLRREAQKKAAEIIPALFIDMFGDPSTNPNGWPVTELGTVSEVQGGLQLSKARASLPLERPYLRVANVHRSRLDLSEIKSIRLSPSEFERTKLAAGDLLIVEGHGNPDEIGRVGTWDGSIEECVHQNHLIRVRCNRAVVKPEFACEYLNSMGGRQSLLRSGKTTSGLNTISVSNVKAASMFVPPISKQAVFAERINVLRALLLQQSSAFEKADAAFTALMARVFSQGLVDARGLDVHRMREKTAVA